MVLGQALPVAAGLAVLPPSSGTEVELPPIVTEAASAGITNPKADNATTTITTNINSEDDLSQCNNEKLADFSYCPRKI